MALIHQVHDILVRLGPHWAELFAAHGLDITVPVRQLEAELARPLRIDHGQPGFEEFAFDGRRAVEPGVPGLSLLYHAFASADVRPHGLAPQHYPTIADIDTVENYVYGAARRTLGDFVNPVIAVFAYQYREAGLAPHRRHADLCFSRCGVARVGSEAARYDPLARSFDPRPAHGERGFAALPARYAAFIAEYRSPGHTDQVARQVEIDAGETFLFPVHKLFAGDECLFRADGGALRIDGLRFDEVHQNDKLRRLHTDAGDNPGAVAPLDIFDLDRPPFFRDSATTRFVELESYGASLLVAPVPGPIVALAEQEVEGHREIARFRVPETTSQNRYWTSLQLAATQRGRAAPEYANIRQQVAGGRLVDLNQLANAATPAAQRFDQLIAKGGYEAAHFIDSTADGYIGVRAPAALAHLPVFPALSLVAAIDYFPQVEQVEVMEWIEQLSGAPVGLGVPGVHFEQGGPAPLSDGRFGLSRAGRVRATRRIPNQALKDGAGAPVFPLQEAASRTVTAIVGRRASAGAAARSGPSPFATTWLPDAASDVFAPGWDVSVHSVRDAASGSFNETYASYGLGSPFPEDAKLCAALNSYWPAVAPDASRTYGFFPGSAALLPTSIPLTDGELGYHPQHPRVLAGEAGAAPGWDGDTGPFFRAEGGVTRVNAMNAERSDQTRQTLDGQVGFSGLDRIDTQAFIARMEALRFAREQLPAPAPDQAGPWLVGFEVVGDWTGWDSAVSNKLDPALAGPGYVFDFAYVNPQPRSVGDPPLRLEYDVKARVAIQLDGQQGFVLQHGGAGPRRVAR